MEIAKFKKKQFSDGRELRLMDINELLDARMEDFDTDLKSGGNKFLKFNKIKSSFFKNKRGLDLKFNELATRLNAYKENYGEDSSKLKEIKTVGGTAYDNAVAFKD